MKKTNIEKLRAWEPKKSTGMLPGIYYSRYKGRPNLERAA